VITVFISSAITQTLSAEIAASC